MSTNRPIKMLRAREVEERTGYCGMHIWRLERDGKFPKRCKLSEGGRAVGWVESEVEAYLDARRNARQASAA